MPVVRSAQADIYYEVHGNQGPPLVLIRGFASTLDTWNGVEVDLGRDHRLLLLDNRGVGRSSCPHGGYRVGTMADDVLCCMGAAGFGPAHVVGTSLGGMIAQELAARHPRRVRSLALVATSPGRPIGRPLRRRAALALAISALLPPQWRAMVSGLVTLSLAGRDVLSCSRLKALKAGTAPLAGLIGQAVAVLRHGLGPRLYRLSVPTLVIHGSADRLIDSYNARLLARTIPNARLEIWPGHGHDLSTEAPQRLARSIRRHVQRVEAGRPPVAVIRSARVYAHAGHRRPGLTSPVSSTDPLPPIAQVARMQKG